MVDCKHLINADKGEERRGGTARTYQCPFKLLYLCYFNNQGAELLYTIYNLGCFLSQSLMSTERTPKRKQAAHFDRPWQRKGVTLCAKQSCQPGILSPNSGTWETLMWSLFFQGNKDEAIPPLPLLAMLLGFD